MNEKNEETIGDSMTEQTGEKMIKNNENQTAQENQMKQDSQENNNPQPQIVDSIPVVLGEHQGISDEHREKLVEHLQKREKEYRHFDMSFFALKLLKDEPFFAVLSRSISKIQNRTIPTCQVCVNPYSYYFELHYNPEFLMSLGEMDENGNQITDPEAILKRKQVEILGVLKHEFYHLIFEHITERLPAETKGNFQNSMLWNWATDLAINSFIPTEIPFFGLVPGRSYMNFETKELDETFKNYHPLLSSETYYSKLKADENVMKQIQEMENQMKMMSGKGNENGNGKGSGQMPQYGKGKKGTLDDHSKWIGEGAQNEMNPTQRSMAKERLREMLQRSVNEINRGSKNWGSVSEQIQKEIYRFINGHLDWKAVLRYFVKTSQKADKHSSIKKINKRFPYVHPGKKVNRTAQVAISIDQSGSVSDEMLVLFFSELNKLSDYASFTVIPFDDHVFEEKIYEWKKGENKRWERVLCGGTNFDAPTTYVNGKHFDGHIVLTDLCAPKPGNSKCQRMWLTTESCSKNPPFKTHERIISIPDQEISDLLKK